MALLDEVQKLKDFKCSDEKCVLTVYLNTDPANQDQQKGEWQIRLKNGLKRIQEYLDASGDESEIKSYKKLKKKVDDEIQSNRTNFQKSVVIFASEKEDLFSVHYLQVPVETSFHWEEGPVLDQLEEIQRHYPRSGVVLPNLDEVRVLDTSLGEIHDERTYEFDPGSEEWTFKEGLASSDRTASGASHVDKLDQRFAENRNRFYKKMAGNIERLKKDWDWQEIYLVGETENIRSLESSLRTKPAESISKNLNNAEASKVLEEVFK